MNSIQLRIRIDELRSRHTTDGKLVVEGICSFKFSDNGETRVRPLSFTGYGQAAVSLNDAGIGSVHAISGRLNIHPPSDTNPNHSTSLTIQHSLAVQSEGLTPATGTQSIPVPVVTNNNGQIKVLEPIPF
ncbi:MAG: hypothetical protein ACRDEA_12675 [Microcystaceae cyanobacterium]